MKRRVLIGGLFHETHTLIEGTSGAAEFQVRTGDDLLACAGDASPLGGALEAAREFGWTLLPTLDVRAAPGPTVEDLVVENFWQEFRQRAEGELARGVDGILLVLHGAMASQSLVDVEGEILERIRRLPGGDSVPLFGVFDLHANFTARMAQHANCLVAYRENPHIDARESAHRAAALLERCFATGRVPRQFWRHPPIVWPPTGTGTAVEPMCGLEALARRMEDTHPEFWAVNVVGGFAFADTPDTGVSFSVVTEGTEALAQTQLQVLCDHAGRHREAGNVIEPDLEHVMKRLNPLPPGLTVLVEPSENIGGGAPGDGTGILRALVNHRIPNSALALNDPAAVEQLATIAIGAEITLALGGKGSRLDAGPLTLPVRLVSRSDGRFELEDKQSHLASLAGNHFEMGPCAVVRHEGVTILLTSRRTPPFDLGQWRSQGIDPARLSVIGVKAAVAHRRAYDPIAARMFWVNTPGPCTSDLRTLPYQRIQRPIYPLD